jgi:hypothetical protein
MASLTLADGQATPVSHTFGVGTVQGSQDQLETKATWYERNASILSGYFRLTHAIRQPASSKQSARLIATLSVPVVTTVNGVPTVVRTSSLKLECNFAQDSTAQERWDMISYLLSFAGKTEFKTSVQNMEPFI